MQQIKRKGQRNNVVDDDDDDDSDDDSVKKFKIGSNNSSRKSISNFENLSNETIFQIFELLDFDHLYKAFSNLNKRFQNLLADPLCSISFSLPFMSKSTFQRYYTEIIQRNQHRIRSLSLPNIFMINHILTPICNASKLVRLETLKVNNILSKHLNEIFRCLLILPALSSLNICPHDYVEDKAKFYCQILGLSQLKYCKIWLLECNILKQLSISSNYSSSIEHLVIKDNLHINTLMVLLSYIPHLRHLSVNSICKLDNEKMESCSIINNQLTYIDLHVDNIGFDDFVLFIKKLSPRLDTLRLSTNNDKKYLDGNEWQQLILSEMPYLRVFDLQVSYDEYRNFFTVEGRYQWEASFTAFQSSFYVDRQWFFAYQRCGTTIHRKILFYSTDPYRRKQYKLYTKIKQLSSTFRITHVDSVKRVIAEDEKSILNCSHYFPNAIELELVSFNSKYLRWNKLNDILPLQQITKIKFVHSDRNLESLFELLKLAPNLQTLEFISSNILAANDENVLFEKTKIVQLILNQIKTLIIYAGVTLENIKLFIDLFPQVENLSIFIRHNYLRRALRFLLSKNNAKTRHLNSLLIVTRTSENSNETIESLIKRISLQVDYIVGEENGDHTRDIYFWL